MTIFSPESKFSRVMMEVAYSCYLNLLWVVFSVPVFTIGASTAALYAVACKVAKGEEGQLGAQFVRAFRSNFKQATQIWLILLGIGLLLAGDIYVLLGLRSSSTGMVAICWTLLLAVVIAACIVYVVELTFVFPLVARVENTNRAMLVNSLLVGTHYLFATLAVFGIHFLMFIVAVRFFTPILILGEGACAVVSAYVLNPVIDYVSRPRDGELPGGDGLGDAAGRGAADASSAKDRSMQASA